VPGDYTYCTTLVEAVRRDRDSVSERVTEVMLWDELVVREEGDRWLRVSVPAQADYSGWVPRATTAVGTRPMGEPGVVFAACAPLSPAGDEPGTCCGVLSMGSRVWLASETGATTIVGGPDGRQYVVPSRCIRAGEVADRGALAADRALALVGRPYLWGGMTFRGIDCSGLVQVALSTAGITVRRDADMQYEDGLPVERDDVRPGDTAYVEHDGRIAHVMMVTGPDSVVHAYGQSADVTVSALSDDGFAGHIAGFRRHTETMGFSPLRYGAMG